jgi:hypothetical protein
MPAVNGFVNGSYLAQSPTLSAARTVNLIPVQDESSGQATHVGMLVPVPGLVSRITGLAGQVRAQFYQNGRWFCVAGDGFYELSLAAWTATYHGAVADDGKRASISTNGDAGLQLFIVSGLYGYTFTLNTNTFAIIADADFPNGSAAWGWFADGYFFVSRTDTAIYQISDLEDGTAWDALDVAQKSITSDRLQSACVVGRTVWLFGTESIEPWYDSGDTFPWTPVPGALIGMGTLAAKSVAQWSRYGAPCFLAGNDRSGPAAYMATGSTAVDRISNNAVEHVWSTYAQIGDAEGFCYEHRGGRFYWLTFPAADATWVYDATTRFWHERGHWNTSAGAFEAHLARTLVSIDGRVFVGSRVDGTIYEMRHDAYDEAGQELRWQRRFQLPPQDGSVPTFHQALTLLTQRGVGLVTGTTDPLVELRYSDDDGQTWSDLMTAPLGAMGEYGIRVEWRRLGRASQGRVYELSGADPVVTALVNVFLRAA